MRYWPLVIGYSYWKPNHVPCKSKGMEQTSPYVILFGQQPDLSIARVWGCDAYVYIKEREREVNLSPELPASPS
jgi:hypothetical protein